MIVLPGEWHRKKSEREELDEVRGAIICVASAFHAFLDNGNTLEKQQLVIDFLIIIILVLLCLVRFLTEALLTAVSGKKAHDL